MEEEEKRRKRKTFSVSSVFRKGGRPFLLGHAALSWKGGGGISPRTFEYLPRVPDFFSGERYLRGEGEGRLAAMSLKEEIFGQSCVEKWMLNG